MGGGVSKHTKQSWEEFSSKGVKDSLIKDIVESLDSLEGAEEKNAVEVVNSTLAELNEKIKGDTDAPGFAILKIVRESKIKVVDVPRKKKAVEMFKKATKKGATVIMVKDGKVHENKCSGDPAKVTFLIGVAFGKGWTDLGPLNNEGSDFCIFDEDEGDDGDDEPDG